MKATTIVNILSVLFLGSCAEREPPVDLEAEKAQIKRLNMLWLEAESAKDLDSSLTFIAEDALYLPNDWPTLLGHESISRYLEAVFEMPMGTIEGGARKIEVARSGDLAYEFGVTQVPFHFEWGDTVYRTHYLVVWKKVGGKWKAVATSVANQR